ncbi:hypothetical protein B9Z19DRAFT_1122817 [Tuber borchii]|uniref:Uncharacterized protein n=1 Tax=Tuber borchii TaxID=42251 RepID=A0A2T6ZZI9_TUBBO|nr:hypothetical protein B9Z19DRAFT_1122817 [Tuber borchii]
MQFLKTILILLFATLVSAAALPQDVDTAIDASFTGIRTKQSADGKQYTFSIYGDGNLEGTIVFTDDPTAEPTIHAFGASGSQLNGTTLDAAGTAGSGVTSFSTESFLCNKTCRIWNFIRKYGIRAARFIACLGDKIPASCWVNILACMISKNPWICFEAILCSAGPIKACLRG